MKKLLLSLLILGSLLCLTACGGSDDSGNTETPTPPAPVENYTVTFDSNGGSNVASQTVASGSKATKPTNPTYEGFEFVCWNLNDTEFNFNTEITSNITLKASWNENVENFTVSFVYGDVTTTVEVAEGTLVVEAVDPTDEDTHFYGWTLDATASNVVYFDFTTPITSNITLTAHTLDVSEMFAGQNSSSYAPIYNAAHLACLFDVLNGTNVDYKFNSTVVVELMADINLDSSVENNIKYFNGQFKGTFNGNGHAINGLNLKSDIEALEAASNFYFGLFREVTATGTVKNVTFNNALVVNMVDNSSSTLGTGIVCGLHRGLIENVNATNSTVTGADNSNTRIGSLVGRVGVDGASTEAGINNVVISNTVVNGGTHVGGVVGHADYTKDTDFNFTISNVYVESVTVSGNKNVAGIAGYSRVSVVNCVVSSFTYVSTTGSSTIGSMLGYVQQSSAARPAVNCSNLVSYSDYGKTLSSVKDENGIVNLLNVLCIGAASDNAEKTDISVMTEEYVVNTLGFDLTLWTLNNGVLSIVR